jgi:hypothetical protein
MLIFATPSLLMHRNRFEEMKFFAVADAKKTMHISFQMVVTVMAARTSFLLSQDAVYLCSRYF